MSKITVTKGGSILGIKRRTEIPFEALALSQRNMIYPAEAESKEFEVKESQELSDNRLR